MAHAAPAELRIVPFNLKLFRCPEADLLRASSRKSGAGINVESDFVVNLGGEYISFEKGAF